MCRHFGIARFTPIQTARPLVFFGGMWKKSPQIRGMLRWLHWLQALPYATLNCDKTYRTYIVHLGLRRILAFQMRIPDFPTPHD
jgi:hypothetical protein